MAQPWYATREDVKRAADLAETAHADAAIDRALGAGARQVEKLLRRRFYPEVATRYFDWPNLSRARSWVLWLGEHELVDVTSVTAGGVAIDTDDLLLEPVNSGPPYDRIEVNLAAGAAFQAGATHQRAVAVVGTWGYRNDTAPAGTLAKALDSSETTVDVSDSARMGVGSLLVADTERMIVTGRSMLDTGQNTSALTDSSADVTITGITAGTIAVGEVLLIDAERMLVTDVAGTTVIVRRAWDGSVLAAHSNGADIYAPRTLTVERGALGTTAAAHDAGDALRVQVYPELVRDLNVAEAIVQLQQESAAYARTIGEGEALREAAGRGLRDLRRDARSAYGRLRTGAV